MRYPATIHHEGKYTLAEFPDCPGCATQADPGEDILEQAEEALVGWLQSHLVTGDVPPKPSADFHKRGATVIWVPVPLLLAAKLELRWCRQEAGLTQAQLAAKAGVSQQAIQRLESPDTNPSLSTLESVAWALDADVDFSFRRRKKQKRGSAKLPPPYVKRRRAEELEEGE